MVFLDISFDSKKIFTLEKRIVRLMAGAKPRIACTVYI
jgi:hypothetical protein